MKKWMRTIGKITVAACGVVTFFDIVGHPAQVIGLSMYPTLQGDDSRWWKRDYVWLSTWSLQNCSPGTILTFTCPKDASSTHIKRLTAVEGQLVRPADRRDTIMEIPKGHYWMEGDNESNRNDSNVYGPVSIGLVKGRATHVIWPPERWARIV